VGARYLISLYNQGTSNQGNHWSLEISSSCFKLGIYRELQLSEYRSSLMLFEMAMGIWNINMSM